jgi:S-adenosylmethionine:tRNA ribosyltransferase-isomerase
VVHSLEDLEAYDFSLPETAIAQHPLPERDGARMLTLDRGDPAAPPRDGHVLELPNALARGDLLVVNRTRVVAARLRGRKATGGRCEALLLGPVGGVPGQHRALLRSNSRLRVGLEVRFEAPDGGPALHACVSARGTDGVVTLTFDTSVSPYDYGEMPLPPYIKRGEEDVTDRARYQTVFADEPGAVAAPTAGLHLSPSLLAALADRGVEQASVLLHVGPGTFKPLEEQQLKTGRLHTERFELSEETAEAIARTRRRGGRVVSVGTTSTRVLESRANRDGTVEPGGGETDLFLRPGDAFRAVDVLLTNFHLPRSSLLLLVCAFAGRERVLAAYREAVARGYRFYSYGDAMLVI